MPKVRAVLFDLDGTLLDVSARFHRAFNVARQEWRLPHMALDDFQSRYGKGTLTQDLPGKDTGPFWKKFLDEFSHNPLPHAGEPYEGVPAMLGELKERGLGAAVITNRSSAAKQVHGELEGLGLSSHFDIVLSQGDFNFRQGDFGKDTSLYSKETMIHHACEHIGVAPGETVMVGDLFTDIHSGRKAGCAYTIGVLTGGTPRKGLELAGAHHILESAREVLSLLGRTSG
ncbi:MAG: HAD family hydrolase [Bdellovibrionota bacterium]